ncbi:MAG: helix-turn-helix transcriptional regulator [Bacteroidales bacterium]|nr:helix-turn-helix transcriptional regulator [Bacteroidales bacterium]
MKIEFCIDKLDSFLPEIAGQLGLEIENCSFQIPTKQGKGFFSQIQFCDDVLITYYELLLNEESTIIRKKSKNDNIIPIIFWLSNSGIKQELNSENKKIGKDTPNGIFLPANSTETTYTFPKGIAVKNITIFITKDWLRKNIKEQNNYLDNVILSASKFFLFEEISFKMSEVLTQMEDALKNNMNYPLAKIMLYASTLQLIYLFFEKILTRPLDKQLVKITPQDIQCLFKVKAILISEYISIPSTIFLAKDVGMNKSKLQRLFKQVFGKSIYQFAVSVKMNEAQKMLISKKYNVSEVGYMVGYSNLSHFTEKFKEYFGITPKSFLSSL